MFFRTKNAARRKETPESKSFKKDLREKAKYSAAGVRELKKVLKTLEPLYQMILTEHKGKAKAKIKKRERETLKAVKAHKVLSKKLDKLLGDLSDPSISNRKEKSYSYLRYLLTGKGLKKDNWKYIKRYLEEAYERSSLESSRTLIEERIPLEIRRLLPSNLVIELDKSGNIKKMTDRFKKEFETLNVKRERQKQLLSRYNSIVKDIKKDMRSRDPVTQMHALVTSIVMETGIRPGKEGNKAGIKVEGVKTVIETFGAVTLQAKHIKSVSDNFAHIEFKGKKGTLNKALISDKNTLKILNKYIKAAKKDFGSKGSSKESLPLFRTPTGEVLSYDSLGAYFNSKSSLAGILITDFRKLKSTVAVLENLQASQKKLLKKIKSFANVEMEVKKEMVIKEVQKVLTEAYEEAQKSLSHGDMTTTIENYVNPEVLLNFISTGSVAGRIEDIVLRGKTKLEFNLDAFLARASI